MYKAIWYIEVVFNNNILFVSDAHADLDQLMNDLLEDGEFEASEWVSRKQAMASNWEDARSIIWNSVLESYVKPDNNILCHKCEATIATIRCLDCLGSLLCPSCDKDNHMAQPFHDRQTWRNGIYENLPQGMSYSSLHVILPQKEIIYYKSLLWENLSPESLYDGASKPSACGVYK